MGSNKPIRRWASIHYPGHNEHIPGTTNYLRSRTFQSYFGMITRCCYPSNINYEYYGGRGIQVDPNWLASFDSFLADMGHRPRGYSLDRIDPNGDYTASNCRWADSKTQASNRRRSGRRPRV